MVKAIERAKAHFKGLLDEPIEIAVPEWSLDGDDFKVYATPLTLQDRVVLTRNNPNPVEMAANILILKAKDKNGDPLFTKEDKGDLMRSSDSAVIKRIADAIVEGSNADDATVEAAEKN